MEELRAEAGQAMEAGLEVQELERQAQSSRQLYENFLSRFQETRDVDIRVDALLGGEAAMRNALAREPAHCDGWARLAWFEQMIGGPSEEVVDMLRLSFYTAPEKRSLVFWQAKPPPKNYFLLVDQTTICLPISSMLFLKYHSPILYSSWYLSFPFLLFLAT